MRILVLIAGLTLAVSAMAEEKPKVPVKQLDKSSPILMSTESPDDSTDTADAKENFDRSKSRAQDYNSSRSNNSSLMGDAKEKHNKTKSRAQDYNSSRSNTTTLRGGPGKENRCSMGRLDCDDDGDSIPTTDTCRNGVDDDCDGVADDAPANHNSTRSNRTQPKYQDGDDMVLRKRPGRD